MTGDHSAGLCTTVQPAASAGAIFQVDSMNGVFQGVITPTGPIGTRVEMFQCSSLGMLRPSRASAHLSAKKRKFSRRADRGLGHEAMGLAGVDAFEHGDLVGVVLDRVGHAVQELLRIGRRDVAPGLEGPRRGCRRTIDILCIATGDGGEHRAVDRRFRLKGLAGDRRHGPAIDRMPDALGFQFCKQGSGAVAIGLIHILWRRLIHGQSPLASWMLLRFQLVSLSLICMSNDSANLLDAKVGSRWAESALKICSPAFLRVARSRPSPSRSTMSRKP